MSLAACSAYQQTALLEKEQGDKRFQICLFESYTEKK